MFGMEGSDGFEKDISQALEGERILQKGYLSWRCPHAQVWSLAFHLSGFGHEYMDMSREALVLHPRSLVLLRLQAELTAAAFCLLPQFIDLYKGHVATVR